MGIYWFNSGKKSEDAWQPLAARKAPHAAAYSQAQAAVPKPKIVTDAAHLMKSPVHSLTPEDSLHQARAFLDTYRVRHIPIIDADGRLVGIVSDRDLWRESARNKDSLAEWFDASSQQGRKLQDFMNKNVLTASPTSRIREIARAMFTEKIGCMPVVDDAGKIIGIISRSDILRHLVDSMPLESWV